MSVENTITTGGCLCGAVRYEITGPLRDVVNCHCSMCQKLHGNFGSHTKARKANIRITHNDGLAWYKTSGIAQGAFVKSVVQAYFGSLLT